MTPKTRIQFLFESYPVFYQAYITPVVEGFLRHEKLVIQVLAFKGKPSEVIRIVPSYFKRRIIERIAALRRSVNPKLQYNELLALKENVHIVHVQHSFLFPKVLGLLEMSKDKRPRIIITLRGGDTYVKPWVNKKWHEFYTTKGNQVDAFVVMSQHQKQYLHEKWRIDLERIHVIPISFGQTFSIAPKSPNSDQLKIVSVFRMCWEKNIEGNLRVIQCLKAKGLPVHYTIYGDGPDLGQVYYVVDKLGLQDVVEIKGKVPNEQLKESLRAFDFILQLSLSESFGVSVVEAQSLGIPAMVSNSGGLPEAIVPNESGFCVAAHDALKASEQIEHLWHDKALYFKFSERAISFSHQHFTISHEIEALTNLYQELMAKQDY